MNPILLLLCLLPNPQAVGDEDVVAGIEETCRKAAERAAPGVVAIRVEREAPAADEGRGLLEKLLGRGAVFARRPRDGWCSGVVFRPDGAILTTHFNVAGKVKSITVRLADGREFPAKLPVASNATYDIALIRIDAKDLPVLKESPLEDLKPGRAVLALGRGPEGRGLTVNPGLVSALSRLSGRCLQTDAKLNFGNVGGPLVDAEGRLVAVTCKIDARWAGDWGQNSGVGFAVAHDRLLKILPDIEAGKSEAEARRAFLGVQPDLERTGEGVEIAVVQPGSAAEKGGVMPGDVVLEFDGEKIRNFEEMRAAITRKSPGDRVTMKVERGGETADLVCVLGWALE